jgi:hypothetical protein
MAKVKKKLSKLDKLKMRKKELAEKSSGGDFFYISKPGSYRMRSVPVPEDMENGLEIIQFYLGGEIKGVISPASLGLPCAIEEKYQDLIQSDDDDDKETAANMKRKTKFVMPHYRYKDDKGKEVDHEAGVRLLMMTNGQYQDWINYYLEDEIGDPSDPINGYDIKYKREGTGQYDTEYSLLNCKPTKMDKKLGKPIDPEELLKKALPSYDETVDFITQFMGDDDEDEDDGDELKEKPKKKKKVVKKSSGKKKKKKA